MPDGPAAPHNGSKTREIADAIVRVTREGTGRGPVSARVVSDAQTIVVLLQGAFTKGEQTLIEHGRDAEVLALRRAFQEVLQTAYVAEVERITGRHVETFMSTNSTDPDRSAEIFLLGGPIDALDPRPSASSSNGESAEARPA